MRYILLLIMTLANVASAHQQKEAYTTLLFSERTGNVEVSHRFLLHDAEHALSTVLNSEADIALNTESQAQFASYIKRMFQLKNSLGELITLNSVGFEVEGKFIWIYQEFPIDSNLDSLNIKMEALQEVWPDQVNQVNVERAGLVRSARLGAGDGWEQLATKEN